jgi:hypothetical protein
MSNGTLPTHPADLPVDPVYVRWTGELDRLELFRFVENSEASRQNFDRGCGRFKQHDARTAKLMVTLGKLAQHNRALMPLSLAIISRCNPHASIAEWNANLFKVAREVLAGGYDDVELRSGPETFRHSQCQRQYTRTEKFLVLEVLNTQRDDYSTVGWCASQMAAELGIKDELIRFGVKF